MPARKHIGAALLAVCAVLASPAARSNGLGADAIFARAKDNWRARREAPYVSFSLRERYTWRSRVHDNWWQADYRDRDRALVLRRVSTAEGDDARMRGAPIALDLHWHHTEAPADSIDTNPDADAFPILDPLIEPNASFGMLVREPAARLADDDALLDAPTPPAGLPSAAPEAAAAAPELREIGRVEATARDYAIALSGEEKLQTVDAYHLTLTPLRDPRRYRLRDLWVDASSFTTLRLAVQGLFAGKPYEDARWIVNYAEFDGRPYIQQIRTDDTLRFGLDRYVSGLQFDFVQYAFPGSLPDITFAHLL